MDAIIYLTRYLKSSLFWISLYCCVIVSIVSRDLAYTKMKESMNSEYDEILCDRAIELQGSQASGFAQSFYYGFKQLIRNISVLLGMAIVRRGIILCISVITTLFLAMLNGSLANIGQDLMQMIPHVNFALRHMV